MPKKDLKRLLKVINGTCDICFLVCIKCRHKNIKKIKLVGFKGLVK